MLGDENLRTLLDIRPVMSTLGAGLASALGEGLNLLKGIETC
jgi:hypothetical protein